MLLPSTASHREAAVIADVHDAPTLALVTAASMSFPTHRLTRPHAQHVNSEAKQVLNMYTNNKPTTYKSIFRNTTTRASCLAAVDKVPAVAVPHHTAVLDQEALALVLGLIQDTVRHLQHAPARVQVVGEQNRELLSLATAPVGQYLVRVVLVRIVVWSRLVSTLAP
jgi:hypothetical protein